MVSLPMYGFKSSPLPQYQLANKIALFLFGLSFPYVVFSRISPFFNVWSPNSESFTWAFIVGIRSKNKPRKKVFFSFSEN